MEANELRVGNYVECRIDDINDRFDVVKLNIHHFTDIHNEVIGYSYKPIPLTEEWLIKFGFFEKYKSCCNRWNILSFTLLDNEDRNGDLQGVFIYDYKLEVSYVHQLQNLYFALTNEELTIK